MKCFRERNVRDLEIFQKSAATNDDNSLNIDDLRAVCGMTSMTCMSRYLHSKYLLKNDKKKLLKHLSKSFISLQSFFCCFHLNSFFLPSPRTGNCFPLLRVTVGATMTFSRKLIETELSKTRKVLRQNTD